MKQQIFFAVASVICAGIICLILHIHGNFEFIVITLLLQIFFNQKDED